MFASPRWRVVCAAAAVVVVSGACRFADPSPSSSADSGARAAQVHVPLPKGWSAAFAGERLTAGPPGRPLLRIERRSGKDAAVPTASELRAAFAMGAPHVDVQLLEVVESDGLTLLRLGLGEQSMMFGVKRVGMDWFLCDSAVGASAEEVEAALSSCAQLTVGS